MTGAGGGGESPGTRACLLSAHAPYLQPGILGCAPALARRRCPLPPAPPYCHLHGTALVATRQGLHRLHECEGRGPTVLRRGGNAVCGGAASVSLVVYHRAPPVTGCVLFAGCRFPPVPSGWQRVGERATGATKWLCVHPAVRGLQSGTGNGTGRSAPCGVCDGRVPPTLCPSGTNGRRESRRRQR